jgi:nicotinate-nucleotide adenylyltransferase
MNVAIFGGTFDPVHRGHLAVARAAQQACKLGRIYFVPADVPPHKQRLPITPFEHRYAMLALALRDERTFVPSLMESSRQSAVVIRQGRRPNYTIDTVRRFRETLKKTDRLFFIVGIDMFEDIDTWHKPKELLREVEFIVVSRPGYGPRASGFGRSEDLPQRTRRDTKEAGKIHWLGDVAENISSTKLREALASGRKTKWLDPAVVEYIRKEHLYKASMK